MSNSTSVTFGPLCSTQEKKGEFLTLKNDIPTSVVTPYGYHELF